MRYSVPFSDLPSGAVADAYVTLAALVAADTAGYRCRLRSLTVGPADNAPADLNVSVALKRVDDVSAGGAGTATAVTATTKDSLSRAAVIAGAKGHSVEPTTYGTVLWECDLNLRNSVIKEWGPDDAPVISRDQLLGLLAAPRTAAAARLSGVLEFEEF